MGGRATLFQLLCSHKIAWSNQGKFLIKAISGGIDLERQISSAARWGTGVSGFAFKRAQGVPAAWGWFLVSPVQHQPVLLWVSETGLELSSNDGVPTSQAPAANPIPSTASKLPNPSAVAQPIPPTQSAAHQSCWYRNVGEESSPERSFFKW